MTRNLTLYCFPCAGGSATTAYLPWRKFAPAWLTIIPVELPGRGARIMQPPMTDFDAITSMLAGEIARGRQQDYALFGHSFGGLLAYATAHRLRAQGRASPVALIAACSAGPSTERMRRLSNVSGDAALIAELKRLGGVPDALYEHPELLRLTLDALAADFSAGASFTYRAQPPLDAPIIVFGGRADEISAAELEAWELESSRGASVEMWDGGHFFFHERREEFLARLIALLETATAVRA